MQAFHVAAFIKDLQGAFSPPTVKQHLAALRMLFDWLVTGHVLDVNPAHAVRGPKYVVRKGKTPVLTAEEARELLESIETVRTKRQDGVDEEPSLVGLRDRALIGAMVYTFARVNAVLKMKVRDFFVQGRRGWVRLHEKGGKEHEVPCHHNLERYLDEYIAAASIAEDPLLLSFASPTSSCRFGQAVGAGPPECRHRSRPSPVKSPGREPAFRKHGGRCGTISESERPTFDGDQVGDDLDGLG